MGGICHNEKQTWPSDRWSNMKELRLAAETVHSEGSLNRTSLHNLRLTRKHARIKWCPFDSSWLCSSGTSPWFKELQLQSWMLKHWVLVVHFRFDGALCVRNRREEGFLWWSADPRPIGMVNYVSATGETECVYVLWCFCVNNMDVFTSTYTVS